MPSPKYHCNTCLRTTRHTQLHSQQVDLEDELDPDYPPLRDSATYIITQCSGCDDVTIVVELAGDSTNGELVRSFLPPRSHRKRPVWLHKLLFAAFFKKDPKHPLLIEIYSALDNENLRLAALGIRTLIEHIMIEQLKHDHGNFKRNLAAFKAAGHISEVQNAALEKVIEFGHAVTHRAHAPERAQLLVALDVIENVMQAVYIDGQAVANALKALPPRKLKSAAAKAHKAPKSP